jgi:hypothetical protein
MEQLKDGMIKKDVQLDELRELYNATIAETIDKKRPDKDARKKLTDLYV